MPVGSAFSSGVVSCLRKVKMIKKKKVHCERMYRKDILIAFQNYYLKTILLHCLTALWNPHFSFPLNISSPHLQISLFCGTLWNKIRIGRMHCKIMTFKFLTKLCSQLGTGMNFTLKKNNSEDMWASVHGAPVTR